MVVHGETDPHLSLPSTRHFPLYAPSSFIHHRSQSYYLLRFYSQHSSSELSAGLCLTSHLALFQRCLKRLKKTQRLNHILKTEVGELRQRGSPHREK